MTFLNYSLPISAILFSLNALAAPLSTTHVNGEPAKNKNDDTPHEKSAYCVAFDNLTLSEKEDVFKTLVWWETIKSTSDRTCSALLIKGMKSFAEIISEKRAGQRSEKELVVQIKNFFKYRQILVGDEKNTYFPQGRNVPSAPIEALVHEGRKALQIQLRLQDKGGVGDWKRDGVIGSAQRVEFGPDSSRYAQRYGGEYWFRLSVFIPKDYVVDNRLTLSDFKNFDGSALDYLHTLQIQRWGEEVVLALDTKTNSNDTVCFDVLDVNGNEGAACQGSHTVYILAGKDTPMPYGEWVDFIILSKMHKAQGELHVWLNGVKKLGLQGNTSLWFDKIAWKGGFYRNGMQEPNFTLPTQDATFYLSHLGMATGCNALDISDTECNRMSQQRSDLIKPSHKIFDNDFRVDKVLVPNGWKIIKRYGG